ncbi:S1 family peptidase [Denitrobaculum tricleocarpae]|uniref:S1 family peptidase n=1 Tax=Denitrobaculum tricleocarpae TaxID=2591009 RepID=UPI0015D2D59C|nr:serine protease [Denitrobaculum tricleocarpae]
MHQKTDLLKLLPFALVAFAVLILPAAAHAQDDDCRQPVAVCAARLAVFAISAFDPVGSAVRIGETQLVTARHVVADRQSAELFLQDGSKIEARVVPSDYKADIILLSAPDLPPGPVLQAVDAQEDSKLFTVGADVRLQRIRAYDPGGVTLLPAEDKALARLHHTAHSQPGNSGGALVDQDGRLIGIVAAGGEGRHEAVPSADLATLKDRSGPEHEAVSAEIGAAVRICTLQLENLRGRRGALDEQQIKALTTACRRSGNRQLYDLAGQAFGIRRMTDESLALFLESIEQDPHALNSRIGLAITYHMALRYEEELPHLHFLMQHAPKDPQVLRFAIQAGVWGNDLEIAQLALKRLKEVDPRAALAAEHFMKEPPPRPQPR